MEEEYFVFDSVYKAIEFYNHHNPARAKSVNLLEAGGATSPRGIHFSGDHPEDIFSSVVHAVEYMFRVHSDTDMRITFKLYHLYLPKDSVRLSCKEVAKAVGVSAKKARKWLDSMESTLERELIRRQLLTERLLLR